MLESTVKKILNAAVYGAAKATSLDEAASLSKKLANRVMIKREDLQSVFSFKIRGAFNKMQQLTDEQKKKGVISASAGNHAQGVAESGRILGVQTTIVMPSTTPAIKVKSVRDRGGKVILHGDAYDDAFQYSQILMAQKDLTFIHPFDDIDVIAGQGTVAREILQEVFEPIEAIFIPVGGGGLCAGMAAYIKYLRPEIKIIAVEYEESACLKAALEAGKRVVLDKVGIFADGVAVAQIGKAPFSILKDHVDEVVTISAAEICAAIKDIFDDTRSVAEPAGALGVAGLKKYVHEHNIRDCNLIAISTGANMNFDRLRFVAEQANLGEQTEALLAVTISEEAGSFKEFCSVVGKRTITEFNYRYNDPTNAQIFVGVQVSDYEDQLSVIKELVDNGYQVEDLSQNGMATNHIRYMVGGRAEGVQNEKIYRFEFPERPNALLNFLKQLGFKWNISLFHYRNNGAAYGKVLVGIQIPQHQLKDFERQLSEIGYRYWDESNNSAYKLFLA